MAPKILRDSRYGSNKYSTSCGVVPQCGKMPGIVSGVGSFYLCLSLVVVLIIKVVSDGLCYDCLYDLFPLFSLRVDIGDLYRPCN